MLKKSLKLFTVIHKRQARDSSEQNMLLSTKSMYEAHCHIATYN